MEAENLAHFKKLIFDVTKSPKRQHEIPSEQRAFRSAGREHKRHAEEKDCKF